MSPSSTSPSTSATKNSASFGQYGARPYESDGGFSVAGLLATTAAGVGVAIATGVLAAIVGRFFYVILIFPVFIGAAVGGIQMWAIRHSRIRTPIACGAAGLVAGAVAVTTMHYVDYVSFRQSMSDNAVNEQIAQQALALAEDAEDREFLEQMIAEHQADAEMVEAKRVDSFFSYLDWNARQGVELTSTRGNSKPLNLGYAGSYVYWGLEAVIVALVAAAMARSRASEPFCAACDAWKVKRELGTLNAQAKGVSGIVDSGRLNELANVAGSSREVTAISVYECLSCSGEGEVVVQADSVAYNNGNRVTSKAGRAVYPSQVEEELTRYFASCEEMPLCDDIDPETLRMLKAAAEGRTIVEPAGEGRDAGELVAGKR